MEEIGTELSSIWNLCDDTKEIGNKTEKNESIKMKCYSFHQLLRKLSHVKIVTEGLNVPTVLWCIC